MPIAIQIIWWIGLIGALILTVIILLEVSYVLRVLKDIHYLAQRTGQAAHNLTANLSPINRLPELETPAGDLQQASRDLAAIAAALDEQVNTLPGGPTSSGD